MQRIWIAMLSTLLLAGCQQPGDGAGTQSASARDERLHFFEPEFSDVLKQVVENLGNACGPSATDEDRLNRCVRDHFADAFDDSRQGRRECDFHSDLSDFIACITVGNSLIDIRHRLSDDSPVTPAFWRQEGAMVDALTDTIVERGIDRCGVSGTTDQVEACVMGWFEKQVALPTDLAGRCEAQSEEKARYVCFVEGVMVRYLQDHVPRLGATSI